MAQKLKGLTKLTRKLNEYTKNTFNVTCRFGHEFQALPTDKIVYYAIVIPVWMQDTFFADVYERFPDIEVTDFTWLLFHEIGHCMTDYMWTQEEENFFQRQKKLLNEEPLADNVELKNEFYHIFPDEYFATRWAVNYIREHENEIAEFEEMWYETFTEFIKINEIEA